MAIQPTTNEKHKIPLGLLLIETTVEGLFRKKKQRCESNVKKIKITLGSASDYFFEVPTSECTI